MPRAAPQVDLTTQERHELERFSRGRTTPARLVVRELLRTGRYRHQPIRRVHIPKPGGSRPIGVSTIEDKIVQDAIREVLEAVYEQDFLSCSFGFRPGRSAHDALRVINRVVHAGEVNWILEADIVSFFDDISRKALMQMLRTRIVDGMRARASLNATTARSTTPAESPL